MTKRPHNAALGVTPYTLTDADLLAIGRIVRGCAEIEDIIDAHLCQVADISPGQLLIFLGRSNMRSKLAMAEQLAKVKSKAAFEAHRTCFNHEAFSGLVKCRNAVAHGVLLGKLPDGAILFRTATANKTDDDTVAIKAIPYSPDDLQTFAKISAELIPQFDKILRTTKLRRECLE